MLHALSKDQFLAVRPLFEPLLSNMVIDSILHEHTPGRIWVDDAISPAVAVLWDLPEDRIFLVGNSVDDLMIDAVRDVFLTTIVPMDKERGGEFAVFECSPAWEEMLSGMFSETSLTPDEKLTFRYESKNTESGGWMVGIPDTIQLRFIDKDLLEGDLDNVADLQVILKAMWGDVNRFLSNGAGVCLVTEGTIIGRYVTDFVQESKCELYVDVFKEHRRQGLATMMVNSLVARLMGRGLAIYWHAWHSNEGSCRLAEKCGFVLDKTANVYMIQYDSLGL